MIEASLRTSLSEPPLTQARLVRPTSGTVCLSFAALSHSALSEETLDNVVANLLTGSHPHGRIIATFYGDMGHGFKSTTVSL